MARTQSFPGQEISLLFVISLGRIFKTYWFDVHECFPCTYKCTPEEGTRAHRATLTENSGALCGCWECNGGPLSALNHWVTSPDPSLGNYKSIFILNCVYVQVDTCMIAGNQRPKDNMRFPRAGFAGGCETNTTKDAKMWIQILGVGWGGWGCLNMSFQPLFKIFKNIV